METRKDQYKLLETKTLFKGEQFKGMLASLCSGTIANSLNYILTTGFKWNIQSSTLLSLYIVGNLFTYIFDILFAKSHFWDSNLNKNIFLPFNAFSPKLKWLLKSFTDKYFMKFFVTVMIDSIIGVALLKYAIKKMNYYNILTKYKHRDLILAALVSAFTFILYLNPLRFNWAYHNDENPVLNMIVIVWFTISLLIMVKFDDLKSSQSN